MKTTLEQEIEIEELEDKLTTEYDNLMTDKGYVAFRLHFKKINELEQKYWDLTQTYFYPYGK